MLCINPKWLLVAGVTLPLLGCGGSTPQPKIYVLGRVTDPRPVTTAETGRPVVEMKTVSVPDYLDTLDIQVRDGQNGLKPSLTGRWGERLSVGITRILADGLTRRLPRSQSPVITSPSTRTRSPTTVPDAFRTSPRRYR